MKSYCVYEIETANEKERQTILEIFKEYRSLEEVKHLRDECSPDVFCLKFEIDGNGQTYESFFDDVDNAIVKLDYAAFEIERYVPYDFYVLAYPIKMEKKLHVVEIAAAVVSAMESRIKWLRSTNYHLPG
ncbi:MAG: hypothetical protein IPJ38_04940 [Dechloromonas sp.]|uniref:Uncharacterized protein n=1 Tax=Candidatus Dechloromonas phosphorivorans TaxID=2899244 RepID=A0A935JVK7_9RHOO|nr:hypothetical protein [Candidatus Dechloromonas phosphorivorans]